MNWFVHGVNGAVVQKRVGEQKQELIHVQTVMNKLKHATSCHRVPDLVNQDTIFFIEGYSYGAIFTLRLSILTLNSQCKESPKYVNILLRTSIRVTWIHSFLVLVMDNYNTTDNPLSPPLLIDFQGRNLLHPNIWNIVRWSIQIFGYFPARFIYC